jgi:hypothetical protein
MKYRKIMLEVVVAEEDSEVMVQALNNALEHIEETVTVYHCGISEEETGAPERADESCAKPE